MERVQPVGCTLRRIAPLLADLFVRHGVSVEADATVPGRRGSGAEYVVPLAIRHKDATLLVDGDFTGCPVDNVTLATFREACYDSGSSGLFIHSGPLSTAAARVVGDRIRIWSADALAQWVGESELAAALGRPLPGLPDFQAWPVVGGPAAELALPAAGPGELPADGADLAPLEIELPPSAAADVEEISDDGAATAVSEPFIELADETPVLHLEEATATVAEVEPAPAAATEAPDVIPLTEVAPLPAPTPAPALDVLDAPSFEVPTMSDLLPPAFRAPAATEPAPLAAPTLAPAPAAVAGLPPIVPPVFALPEAEAPAPKPAGAEPLRAPEGSQGLLPPRVTLKEAKALVADRLFSIEEAELILQPVHLFDYAVDVLRPGKVTSQAQGGRLQVNGTDRRVSATDPAKCDPRLPHRVFATGDLTVMDKVLRVSPERAEQLATTWAQAEHAKVVDVTTDRADDSFALVERKSVSLTSGQVNLTPLGLWHRPFWRLWGSNGHADIDAVEGTVLDEEIKAPNPDFLVVD